MIKIPLNNQSNKKSKILVLEDIDISTSAHIISHSGRVYVSLRNAEVEFWGLKKGDIVLLKIVKVKRASLPGEDFEKVEEEEISS